LFECFGLLEMVYLVMPGETKMQQQHHGGDRSVT